MTKLLNLKRKAFLTVESQPVIDFDFDYNVGTGVLTSKPTERPRKVSGYKISKELANAVNAAIITGRPLLIKGEPGSGKTKLAQAVAVHLYKENAYKYYFEWHVKSKSKAKDGGYTFDHVGRLRDATIIGDAEAQVKAAVPANYVSLGPMGYAFKSGTQTRRPILLIDEIDKGDIDFPNDLLLELDEMRFKINEVPKAEISAPQERRPLVFITSNDERELPPAFLRRCLYYSIPPFKKEFLVDIARSKLAEFYEEHKMEDPKDVSVDSLAKFVDEFLAAKNKASTKQPSTSELLDWLKLLTHSEFRKDRSFDELIKDTELRGLALKLNA